MLLRTHSKQGTILRRDFDRKAIPFLAQNSSFFPLRRDFGRGLIIPTPPPTATNTVALLKRTSGSIVDLVGNDLKIVSSYDGYLKQSSVSRTATYSTEFRRAVLDVNIPHLFNTDFTVECWFVPAIIDSNYRCIFARSDGQGFSRDSTFYLVYKTNSIYLGLGDGTTYYDASAPINLNLSAWNHVALIRYNNICTVYFDGIRAFNTATLSNLIDIPGTGVTFGSSTFAIVLNLLGSRSGDGLYEQMRISNIARYTANFTPQITPFVVD